MRKYKDILGLGCLISIEVQMWKGSWTSSVEIRGAQAGDRTQHR